MSDLISRKAAIKAVENLKDCYNGFSDTYDKAYIIGVLEEVPAIKSEWKTGQWIKAVDELGETWMCSECCEEWTVEESVMDEFPQWAHYCPNCGTRMVNNDV